jgi:hypothetical protein
MGQRQSGARANPNPQRSFLLAHEARREWVRAQRGVERSLHQRGAGGPILVGLIAQTIHLYDGKDD